MSPPNPSDQMVDHIISSSGDASISEHPIFSLANVLFPGASYFLFILYRYFKKSSSRYTRPFIVVLGMGLFLRYTRHAMKDYLLGTVQQHFMSRAELRQGDEMFKIMKSWLNGQPFSKKSRFFQVSTSVNGGSERAKRTYLNYPPAFGSYRFWHKGRLFFIKKSSAQSNTSGSEEIAISTIGRNPACIKDFLEGRKEYYVSMRKQMTPVFRVEVVSGKTEWTYPDFRTSRPFSTVVVDEKIKQSLTEDLKEYLSDDQERWYRNRGIPYRRGYLLHGPPGCGKSSLSFALAGYFELSIFVLSLSSEMDDATLANLFSLLPDRCIVLLEDIDTAGLTHQRTESADDEKSADGKAVSLSGLLNVIDGVASQEGRVLIMTTNHIDKLDDALIRPGRVDVKVEFSLANEAQLIQLFKSIYETLEGDIAPDAGKASTASSTSEAKNAITLIDTEPTGVQAASAEAIYQAKINFLAHKFAASIPSEEFSPAEIQGYLLGYKREPEIAAEKVAEWVAETRASKISKREKDLGTKSVKGASAKLEAA